jgi:hypothetical protein
MKLLRSFAFLLLGASALPAATVAWYNDEVDLLPMIQADGSYLDNSFSFEMGTFVSGFDPNANAYATWQSNWRRLDVATAPATEGWNSVNPGDPGHDVLDTSQPAYNNQYLDSQFSFNSNGTVQGLPGSATFAAGEVTYLWVYNTQVIGSGTQWALIRDATPDFNPDPKSAAWVLPNPTNPDALEVWSIEEADLAVVGAVNNVGTGIARGAGNYSNDLGGAFRVQTVLIPEPSSAMLALVSGLALQLRRKRGKQISVR